MLGENGVLGALQLDRGACVLAGDDLVAHLDGHGSEGAVVGDLTGADGDDLGDLGLLLGGGGQKDTARGLLLRLDELDDDAVGKGIEFHVHASYYSAMIAFFYSFLPLEAGFCRVLALFCHECQPHTYFTRKS